MRKTELFEPDAKTGKIDQACMRYLYVDMEELAKSINVLQKERREQ